MTSPTPIVPLDEDRDYAVSDISQVVANQWQEALSRDSLEEEILRFFSRLAALFSDFNQYLYPELDVEAPPPRVDFPGRRIHVGEWIGWFELDSEVLGSPVMFSVTPKVGSEAFAVMLNDVLDMIKALGLPTMRVIWRNVLGDTSPTATLSHSHLLSYLTALSVLEGLPRAAVAERLSSETLLGQLDVASTAREQRRGRPVVVSRRVKVAEATLPLLFLVRFNLLMHRDLLRWRTEFAQHQTLLPLVQKFDELSGAHRAFLSDETSIAVLDRALDVDLESQEALEILRASCSRMEWLRRAIDQYEVYLRQGRVGQYLLDRNRTNLPIQPIPSSKLYEVWILRLVLDSLLRRQGLRWNQVRSRATPTERGSLMRVGEIRIGYNVDDPSWSYILGALRRSIRPDLMISRDGGRAVVDAKYRNWAHVAASDLERLIAYLVDYAQPQKEEEIKGFLVLLQQDDQFKKLGERVDVHPRIRLFSLVADPREREAAVRNVGRMCEKVVG